jgi:hypothetical protein
MQTPYRVAGSLDPEGHRADRMGPPVEAGAERFAITFANHGQELRTAELPTPLTPLVGRFSIRAREATRGPPGCPFCLGQEMLTE